MSGRPDILKAKIVSIKNQYQLELSCNLLKFAGSTTGLSNQRPTKATKKTTLWFNERTAFITMS